MNKNYKVNSVSDLSLVSRRVQAQNDAYVTALLLNRLLQITGSEAAANQIGPERVGAFIWEHVFKGRHMPPLANLLTLAKAFDMQVTFKLQRFDNDIVYDYIELNPKLDRRQLIFIMENFSRTYGASTPELQQFQAEQIKELKRPSSRVSWRLLTRFFAAGGFRMNVWLRTLKPAYEVYLR
jgi:hypothetical protein